MLTRFLVFMLIVLPHVVYAGVDILAGSLSHRVFLTSTTDNKSIFPDRIGIEIARFSDDQLNRYPINTVFTINVKGWFLPYCVSQNTLERFTFAHTGRNTIKLKALEPAGVLVCTNLT